MATKHTPVPWTLKSWYESEIVTTQDGDPIAMVYADKNRKFIVRACNAHNDMLEALKLAEFMLSMRDDLHYNEKKALKRVKAAITKATGNSDLVTD